MGKEGRVMFTKWHVETRECGGKTISAYVTHNHPTRYFESAVLSESGIVAQGIGATVEESETNAHLIAAAPDLYEACKEAIYSFAHGVGAMSSRESDPANAERNINEAARIQRLLVDAIAKAEGKS